MLVKPTVIQINPHTLVLCEFIHLAEFCTCVEFPIMNMDTWLSHQVNSTVKESNFKTLALFNTKLLSRIVYYVQAGGSRVDPAMWGWWETSDFDRQVYQTPAVIALVSMLSMHHRLRVFTAITQQYNRLTGFPLCACVRCWFNSAGWLADPLFMNTTSFWKLQSDPDVELMLWGIAGTINISSCQTSGWPPVHHISDWCSLSVCLSIEREQHFLLGFYTILHISTSQRTSVNFLTVWSLTWLTDLW